MGALRALLSSPRATCERAHRRKCQTITATPAKPGDLLRTLDCPRRQACRRAVAPFVYCLDRNAILSLAASAPWATRSVPRQTPRRARPERKCARRRKAREFAFRISRLSAGPKSPPRIADRRRNRLLVRQFGRGVGLEKRTKLCAKPTRRRGASLRLAKLAGVR